MIHILFCDTSFDEQYLRHLSIFGGWGRGGGCFKIDSIMLLNRLSFFGRKYIRTCVMEWAEMGAKINPENHPHKWQKALR